MDLEGKMFSSKTCHMKALPTSIIERAELVRISEAPSKNQEMAKLLYDKIYCKNILLQNPVLKSQICKFFFGKYLNFFLN